MTSVSTAGRNVFGLIPRSKVFDWSKFSVGGACSLVQQGLLIKRNDIESCAATTIVAGIRNDTMTSSGRHFSQVYCSKASVTVTLSQFVMGRPGGSNYWSDEKR